jgi:hypothetical protein
MSVAGLRNASQSLARLVEKYKRAVRSKRTDFGEGV